MHLYACAGIGLFVLMGMATAMVVVSPLLFATAFIAGGLAVHASLQRLRRALARRRRPGRARVTSPAGALLRSRRTVTLVAPARRGIRPHVNGASAITARRRREPRWERH